MKGEVYHFLPGRTALASPLQGAPERALASDLGEVRGAGKLSPAASPRRVNGIHFPERISGLFAPARCLDIRRPRRFNALDGREWKGPRDTGQHSSRSPQRRTASNSLAIASLRPGALFRPAIPAESSREVLPRQTARSAAGLQRTFPLPPPGSFRPTVAFERAARRAALPFQRKASRCRSMSPARKASARARSGAISRSWSHGAT